MPDELDVPPVPLAASALWDTFLTLCASRGSGGFSPAPLTQADLWHWQRNQRVRLTAWELDTLQAMDRAALSTQSEGSK